eukprot:1600462-Prymnesium_polylepis.1
MLGGTGRICAQDARAFRAAWSVYSCVLALTLMGIGSVISVASSDTCSAAQCDKPGCEMAAATGRRRAAAARRRVRSARW